MGINKENRIAKKQNDKRFSVWVGDHDRGDFTVGSLDWSAGHSPEGSLWQYRQIINCTVMFHC
jgi:hypothetical protein